MSTAPGVCVCVCVCLHYCVCVLGWVKYREHISLLVILCIIMYVTNKKIYIFFSFSFFFFTYFYEVNVRITFLLLVLFQDEHLQNFILF